MLELKISFLLWNLGKTKIREHEEVWNISLVNVELSRLLVVCPEQELRKHDIK